MDEWLSLLRANEPVINAAVGLLTLMAALWGVFRFALVPWIGTLRSRASSDDSGEQRAEGFRLWTSLVDRGLDSGADLIEQVSVRTLNATILLVVAATLIWLVITLLLGGMLILSILNSSAFLLGVLAYNLQAAGRGDTARWVLIGDLALYWGCNIVLMGTGVGLEYFLGGLVVLPVLLFDKDKKRQLYLAVGVFLLTLPLAILLQNYLSIPLPEGYADELVGYYYVNAIVLAALVFGVLFSYNRSADDSFRQLEDQKQQSDELIHKILPAYIAEKVSARDANVASWHSEASVLFATVHGFEKLYKRISAVQMVELLSQLFAEFDQLLELHGVEKINTLGTSYVAAIGVDPESTVAHRELVHVAMGMREVVNRLSDAIEHPFTLRVGISTGDLVSGVIGEARPSFDVWGKTVDMADSLRDSAQGGGIVVNEAAFWRLRQGFRFEPWGSDESCYRFVGNREEAPSISG
jgi:adenylate cyclase